MVAVSKRAADRLEAQQQVAAVVAVDREAAEAKAAHPSTTAVTWNGSAARPSAAARTAEISTTGLYARFDVNK